MSQNALIVEGNELLVKMYRSIFATIGCDVVHARTKEDALRRLDKSEPDLFIVDESLADGQGIDAMREIRSRRNFANTPIIATVSARRAHDDDELRALRAAFVVTKPWQVGAFSTLARRCLDTASKATG